MDQRSGTHGTIVIPAQSQYSVPPRMAEVLGGMVFKARPSGRLLIVHAPGTISPSLDPYTTLPRHGAWWGDIVTNQFVEICTNDRRALDERFREIVVAEYMSYIERWFEHSVQQKHVSITNARFLINEKYFTEEFIDLSPILGNGSECSRIAEWVYLNAPEDTDLLVSVGPKSKPVADAVARVFWRMNRTNVVVALAEKTNSPDTIFSNPSWNKVLLITDVIGSSETLVNHVIGLRDTAKEIHVVALVDTRNRARFGSDPLKCHFTSVKALLHHEVERKPFASTEVKGSFLVVDETTQRPLQYSRSSGATNHEMFLSKTATVGALRWRHWEHAGRHYSFYIDIPSALLAVEKEFKTWFGSRISQWNEQYCGALYFFDVHSDISQTIRRELVYACGASGSVSLMEAEVAAPRVMPIPGKKDCIAVIPAIGSGRTAERLIRYLSAEGYSRILLIGFLSRLSPERAGILFGISRYGSSEVSVEAFVELCLPLYEPRFGSCPMCTEEQQLRDALRGHLEEGEIRNLVSPWRVRSAKVVGADVVPVTTRVSEEDPDLVRFRVRDLYGRSDRCVKSRSLLQAMLLNGNVRERFLELISYERSSHEWEVETLIKRIGRDSFERLLAHCTELLDNNVEGFPLGRYAPAIAHLLPRQYIHCVPQLLHRYRYSHREIGQILVATLLTNYEVAREWPLAGIEEFRIYRRLWEHLQQRSYQDTNILQVVRSIAELEGLFSGSNPFIEQLPVCSEEHLGPEQAWNGLRQRILTSCKKWNSARRTRRTVSEFFGNRHIKATSDESMVFEALDHALLAHLQHIDDAMAELEVQARGPYRESQNEPLRRRVVELSLEVQDVGKLLTDSLGEYRSNPVSLVLSAQRQLVTQYGITFDFQLVSEVASVFVEPGYFTWAVMEIVRNAYWAMAQQSIVDVTVTVKLYEADGMIVVDVCDEARLPGEPPPYRGRYHVERVASEFGGRFGYLEVNKCGKVARLELHAVRIMSDQNVGASHLQTSEPAVHE
ncbi:MAG: hypothetical protein ABIO70_11790 [Pseudomonadota bacterium]